MGTLFFTAVIYPLTQIIETAFTFSYKILKNTGFALLGVSLAVSLLTLPLYAVAEHWQETERKLQAKMKPQVSRIKKYFKGDEQYMILSTYYRQNHYHPLMQLRSAFGILIQIPFFTAAYFCLSHMPALHDHHLLFISDLGKPDALLSIGTVSINVLPLLMTAINCISGTIYTRGHPAKEKIQVYSLALLFAVLLYGSPSGLVIYWTMNNIFSLVKNIFYKCKNPARTFYAAAAAASAAALIFTVISHRFNTAQKLLFILLCLFIILIPLTKRLCGFFIRTLFFPLRDHAKTRTALFLVSAAGLFILTGCVIPSLLIASSPVEFSGTDSYPDPMFFIRNTAVQSFGFLFLWPSLIYFLFKEKIQTLLAALFFCALAIALSNAFLFQGNYGYLSKMLIFTEVPSVSSPKQAVLLNLAAMGLIFAGTAVLIRLGMARAVSALLSFAAVSMVLLSFIQIGKIKAGYREYERVTRLGTDAKGSGMQPLFHLTKTGKNVMLIFLDRAQNRFIEPMLQESPHLKESFSGFTLYRNTVSYNSHTLIGSPPVYGGYEYTPLEINSRPDKTLVEKHNEALLLLPRIFTEQADGFSAASSDASWANYSWIPDISIFKPYPKISAYVTENTYLVQWYEDHKDDGKFTVASDTLKRNILWYGFFRTVPLFLRPAIYENGRYWSADSENEDANKYLANYAPMEYLPRLTDFNAATENYFLSFTNNACHTSYFLQAPDYVPAVRVTNRGSSEYADEKSYSSMAGVIHRLGEWLDYLKENGAYDNSRILIVADHGCDSYEKDFQWDEKFEKLKPGKYHPLFMFKDFNETGGLKVSDEFMTNADGAAMLTEGIVGNAVNPFTGTALSNRAKEDGALISVSNLFMPHHTKSKYVFTTKPTDWYRVSKSIFESKNWKQEIVEEAQ